MGFKLCLLLFCGVVLITLSSFFYHLPEEERAGVLINFANRLDPYQA